MNDRQDILNQINQISFAVNDTQLYLNIHPTDEKAIEFLNLCLEKRKLAIANYEENFKPISTERVNFLQNASSNDSKECNNEANN